MKAFLSFWKSDIINKLIVLTAAALAVGVLFIAYMLITMPAAHTLFGSLLPTSEALPTVVPRQITDTPPPTPTTEIFPSMAVSSPAALTPDVSAQDGIALTAAAVATAVFPPSPTTVDPSIAASACIPANSLQTGKVLGVIDGDTIRVYTGGLVYVVRYIGIQVPRYDSVKELFGQAAMSKNSSLVYGQDVSLIKDVSDKDSAGRLLRYVLIGSRFVNFEMLQAGLATALEAAPDTACASIFKDAEQTARQAGLGRWGTASAPSP